jgi:hypothetical protein
MDICEEINSNITVVDICGHFCTLWIFKDIAILWIVWNLPYGHMLRWKHYRLDLSHLTL